MEATKDIKEYRDQLAEQLRGIGYRDEAALSIADAVALAVLEAKEAIKRIAFTEENSKAKTGIIMHLTMQQLAVHYETFSAAGAGALMLGAELIHQ